MTILDWLLVLTPLGFVLVSLTVILRRAWCATRAEYAKGAEKIARAADRHFPSGEVQIWIRQGVFAWRRDVKGAWHYVPLWQRLWRLPPARATHLDL